MADDTIFALATPPGRSAVAVVRVSGPLSRFALETLAGRVPPARHASLALLREPGSGDPIDSALILFFESPASFTGEAAAEFHLHGGRAVVDATLSALAKLGLRPAEPGEFTRRAFGNGKLDLTAVEGLADLIDAQTAAQRRQALRLLGGSLAARVGDWRERLLDAMSLLEADIDFSDEGDVATTELLEPAGARIDEVVEDLRQALAGARRGERLRGGLTAAIVGPPNAGKSTLLNALARRDVAIVSPLPGTTRDAIEVPLELEGLPVTLVDTAGLRETEDPIESEGIRRTMAKAAEADLLLWLTPADRVEEPPWSSGSPPVLRIATKIDSAPSAPLHDRLGISAMTGDGLDSLLQRLTSAAGDLVDDAAVVTRERHRLALEAALAALGRARKGLMPERTELVAEDVRLAVRALEGLLGRVDVEHVLDRLFLSFCIGK